MSGWNLNDALAATQPAGSMTPLEFGAFLDRHFPPRSRGVKIEDAIGIARRPAELRRSGRIRITRSEALACAHYALGLPLPIPAGSTEFFLPWFGVRFGEPGRISEWLDLTPRALPALLAGFIIRDGVRFPRLPDVTTIRALDWVHRVGPVVPWGDPI